MNEEKIPMIYSAICGVMEDVRAVGKEDYNRTQGFKYRGIDAVMNALNPAMIKHKIFCTPEVLEQNREERTTSNGKALIYSICRMRYRFFTTDGSYVEAIVVGEGMDSGDKATNKAMAVAFKYACFQTFCIPTENLMDDPDADTPEPSRKKKDTSSREYGLQDNERTEPDTETIQLRESLSRELVRTGYSWDSVIKKYKTKTAEQLSKLQLKDCITKMRQLQDKESSE